MRAAVYDRYGPPEVLRVEDVPTPSPAAGQVLVRVAATSINLSDWETLRGSPAYSRIGGLRSPARRTLGSDIAGWVEAVGEGVTRFQPGDEVYGDNLALKGGFAEYAVAAESGLAHKPAELTFAEASTIPQAGAIALQGTEGAAAGRRVLINGAGGGSGSFAIQLAKRLGAHVTGVDNAAKLEFMRSLGADEVIDYRREDFTRSAEPYDLILDLVAHRSVFAYRRALADGGRYRCVGGSVRALLRVLTIGLDRRPAHRPPDRCAGREGGTGPLRAARRALHRRRRRHPHRPHVRARRRRPTPSPTSARATPSARSSSRPERTVRRVNRSSSQRSGSAGAAVGVANHQGWPSRSRAPYSRCPYGWSAGSLSITAPASRVRAKCASTSSTCTTSPPLSWVSVRGEASSSVTRCNQMRASPRRTSPCTTMPSGVRSMPSDVNPNTRTR